MVGFRGDIVLSVFTTALFQITVADCCFVIEMSSVNIEIIGTHCTNVNSTMMPEGNSKFCNSSRPHAGLSLYFQSSSCAYKYTPIHT